MRYIILIFLIAIAGCKKYLDKKPDARQAVPTTLSDLQALLDNAQYMNEQRTPCYMEASSDDYFLSMDIYRSLFKEDQQLYLWNRPPYKFGNDWADSYLPVYTANFCLDGLSKLSKTDQVSTSGKHIEGSARFFRAYYFLELLWQHGKAYDSSTAEIDLGIPLRLKSDFNEPSVRGSIEEGYRQVISDAKAAAALLPDLPEVTVMRPSRAAAYGLLARAYLSMRKYDSAGYYADQALALKNDLMDYNFEKPTRFNKETIFYSEMSQKLYTHMAYVAFIDTAIINAYHVNDLRLEKGFTLAGIFYQFNGNYTGDPYILFTGIATDEMLLIRAEGKARSGKAGQALQDINELLSKRWNNNVSFTPINTDDAQYALEIVLLERRKELLMRGLRWIDVKRMNKEGANITMKRNIEEHITTLEPTSNTYALPLPLDIIEQTGMPQN